LPFGWINALDLHRITSLDQQFSKGPVATTDVDPPQTCGRRHPIKEYLASGPAPNSHHLLVGGTIVETNLLFCHLFSYPNPDPWQTPFCRKSRDWKVKGGYLEVSFWHERIWNASRSSC